MSFEQLKGFIAEVKGDSNLQQKIKSVTTPDEVAAIAKEHGHDIDVDKLLSFQHGQTTFAQSQGLITEEELENVTGAGGKRNSPTLPCGVAFGCGITLWIKIRISCPKAFENAGLLGNKFEV